MIRDKSGIHLFCPKPFSCDFSRERKHSAIFSDRMTLPFPESIRYEHAFAFAALFMIGLLAEGNDFVTCLVLFITVMVGTFGFNQGGGMRRPTGAYVFFVVMFTGTLGAFTKLCLNEPLNENVPNADETLIIYCVGTCAIVIAVLVSKYLRRSKPILKGRLTFQNTPRVVGGCVVAGLLLPFLLELLFPAGTGSLGTIIAQLNIALPLCIVIGVYQKVKSSNGRRSFNWPSFVALTYSFYIGMVGFSKEGMFGGAAAWAIAAAAARMRIGLVKAVIVCSVAATATFILVPYSQYGRNFRLGYGGNYEVSKDLLSHPLRTRQLAIAAAGTASLELHHWYRVDHGILDRLTLVAVDGALIDATDMNGPIGWHNVGLYFLNVVPHFIYPDKPDLATGNQYAHEIGMLAPADHTTGISFSPFAEAYHLGGWTGVIFLLPAVVCVMFISLDIVTGSLDDSPWGLFFIAYFAHGAAEGMLQIPVRMASVGVEAILACAFIMIYVTPLIASLVIGPDRRTQNRSNVFRAVQRKSE